MKNKINFQFDDKLKYQKDAIDSVVNLFKGVSRQSDGTIYRNINRVKKLNEGDPVRNPQIITGTKLLNNLREVQSNNRVFIDNELQNNNFTIEMETGTGKTYVYLRTILELNRVYGFTKFIIVVPSIAIRKGVEKNIEMLREHFKALYDGLDIKNHYFVYDSSNPKKISSSFVETRDLSIAIMNIQAFNKDTNKIRKDDEYGQNLWEDIKYISPIVIIDEPQKIEGTGRKKSASLKAIEMINPLFTLRYSATHRKLYNQVYKLDSYDAFKNNLVKRIEVKTVHGAIPKDYPYIRYVEFTSDLYAKIEIFNVEQGGVIRTVTAKVRGGDSLFEASGELSQYKNVFIQEDPHKLKPLKIAMPDKVLELNMGDSNFNFSSEDVIRIQIRLSIKSHIEKQLNILKKGYKIKVITLFFIDAVNKFRDNTSLDGRGEYLRIFDEEYANIIENSNYNVLFKQYPKLFKEYKNIPKVREGYFAVDKKKKAVEIENWDSILDEQKLKKKSQEEIDRGIELILEKKDELISFNEPLAFIFSHSALREGWDNPNVFTLCTLKHGGSEIAKKQEIGRGLRLPVDINGNRKVDTEINELTVIANDYYEHFADSLQKDFNEQSGFNKDEVTTDIIYAALFNSGIPKNKVTQELVDTFKNELISKKIINNKHILTKAAKDINKIEFTDETLKEHSEMIKKRFIEYMIEKGTKKIIIKNGDEPPVENGKNTFIDEEKFKKLLKELSIRMTKRTMYQVDIDSEAFISDCINEVNELLRTKRIRNEYEVESGKASFDNRQKFVMEDASKYNVYEEINETSQAKSDFEIVNYIMYHTMLPRLAIFKIILALENKIYLNNQDILDEVTQAIKKKFTYYKAKDIIGYKIIDGFEFNDKTIFEAEPIDSELFKNPIENHILITNPNKHRALNKIYKLDSDGEYKFGKSLDEDENVLLYTKLKKGGFVIDTPYGDYSPDWAVIYKDDNETARLYFIVETKFDKEWKDLSDVEKAKIECGELHFKAVADDVRFKWAKSYEDFTMNKLNPNRKGVQ